MKWFIVFGFLLGSLLVFQPVFNRLILEHKGLGFAVLLNGTVLTVFASILCLFIFFMPERFPSLMRFKVGGLFEWWFLLPGFFGILIVSGTPLLIKNIGASSTVILMLSGQLITSFLWDTFAEGQAFRTMRLIGAILAFCGAYLSFK